MSTLQLASACADATEHCTLHIERIEDVKDKDEGRRNGKGALESGSGGRVRMDWPTKAKFKTKVPASGQRDATRAAALQLRIGRIQNMHMTARGSRGMDREWM